MADIERKLGFYAFAFSKFAICGSKRIFATNQKQAIRKNPVKKRLRFDPLLATSRPHN